MKKQIKFKREYLLVIALIGISFLYGYHIIAFHPPYSTHQWRQTDGLSIALNYHKEGMNFLDPKMHFQYSEQGRAIGEFPIIYYLNAAIWKFTGQSYFTARLLNLLLVFAGLLALYKTIYLIIKSQFTALFIPLFVFSSPLIAFYSNNFPVNVPALSIVFICWYFFVRYFQDKKIVYLIFFSGFASLAILLRTTMAIGLCPIFLLFILEKTKLFNHKVFTGKTYIEFILLALPFTIVLLWIIFMRNYNASNNSIYFLTKTMPIWSIESNKVTAIWHNLYDNILPFLYPKIILCFITALIMFLFLLIKRMNKYLLLFNIATILALFAYIILWYANLYVHDYYLIEVCLLIPPLFLSLAEYSKREFQGLYQSKTTKVILVIILSFSVLHSIVWMKIKYNFKKTVLTNILISEHAINLNNWYHWDYSNKFKAYETIKPYLRSIGIKRDDVVVSIPDQSPNISLFFMDQKGYTSLYKKDKSIKEQLDFFINRGAKYLIINDTSLYQKEDFKAYRKNKVGEYYNIEIFKLTKR